MQIDRRAAKEVFVDTLVDTVINFPMNFVLIWFAFRMELSAFVTTVFCTASLFIVALIRKYYIRLHFARKDYDR